MRELDIMDTRIGQLASGEYYAYTNGYNMPEVRGTLREVEINLGLYITTPRQSRSRKPKRVSMVIRTYIVTILTSERADELEIEALTRDKAISKAREWYRSEYACIGGAIPAKYRARLACENNYTS